MNITNPILLKLLFEEGGIPHESFFDNTSRHLQSFTIPDYTSPPLQDALEATPDKYKSETVIDFAREAAKNNICGILDPSVCQILFEPSSDFENYSSPSLGVLFYGGALVDPRAYSPVAKDLADRYGLAVSIPIFANDIAFVGCTSDRLELASLAFPSVEKWVMVGHSMGGVGVSSEIWTALSTDSIDSVDSLTNKIGGLVLMASYVRQDVGCGPADFSQIPIPTASVSAALDGIINEEKMIKNEILLPTNDTFKISIQGANHGGFGSYDDSERKTILNQNDGVSLIPRKIHQDLSVAAIVHVVSRTGITLPNKAVGKKPKKEWVRSQRKLWVRRIKANPGQQQHEFFVFNYEIKL